MSPELQAEKSRLACQALVDLDAFKNAGVIMLYLPIPNEVDPIQAVLAAWQQEKTVLMPKVSLEQRHLIALRCTSLDDEFEAGPLGTRHPAAGQPWPADNIDLVIVPALAYDRTGNRLGRGGGFYDKFLSEPGINAIKCGLAFDEQVLDEIPTQSHDQPVDMLVTDKEVLTF